MVRNWSTSRGWKVKGESPFHTWTPESASFPHRPSLFPKTVWARTSTYVYLPVSVPISSVVITPIWPSFHPPVHPIFIAPEAPQQCYGLSEWNYKGDSGYLVDHSSISRRGGTKQLHDWRCFKQRSKLYWQRGLLVAFHSPFTSTIVGDITIDAEIAFHQPQDEAKFLCLGDNSDPDLCLLCCCFILCCFV